MGPPSYKLVYQPLQSPLTIVISTINHRIQPLINQLNAIDWGPHPGGVVQMHPENGNPPWEPAPSLEVPPNAGPSPTSRLWLGEHLGRIAVGHKTGVFHPSDPWRLVLSIHIAWSCFPNQKISLLFEPNQYPKHLSQPCSSSNLPGLPNQGSNQILGYLRWMLPSGNRWHSYWKWPMYWFCH